MRSIRARPSTIPSTSTPASVGSAASSGPCGPSAGRRRRAGRAAPRRRSTSASRPSLASFATSRAAGSIAANEAGATWTAQPVTMTVAAGLARRARRTAFRDLSSAAAVTVHVFTRWRSAAVASVAISTPRARRSRSTASISAWFTLQPRFVMAARLMGGAPGDRVVIGSPEGRLRRHEEGDQAHGGRDRVGDVALAAGLRSPGLALGVGGDPVAGPRADAGLDAGRRTRRRP